MHGWMDGWMDRFHSAVQDILNTLAPLEKIVNTWLLFLRKQCKIARRAVAPPLPDVEDHFPQPIRELITDAIAGNNSLRIPTMPAPNTYRFTIELGKGSSHCRHFAVVWSLLLFGCRLLR